MMGLDDFLERLLNQGKIVFRSAMAAIEKPSPRAAGALTEAYEVFSLSVAGPRIPFDLQTACDAAELVRQSSRALVNREDRAKELAKRLRMPGSPATPSQHLSADLVLRYLPQILSRARGLDPADPMIGLLEQVLRRWPLSGVLSDVGEVPLLPLDFQGHPGLLLLYAERLVDNDRPAWRPVRPGPGWDYYELVLVDRSRTEGLEQGGWPASG
jgi:hypothetical protein